MAGRAAKFHIWLNMQDCRPPCPWLFINGVSSHFSSPKLIKLVIFSCPYWYIENIHFSLIKSNPNPNHEHKRINPTGLIKSMTHNHCHQSCKAFTKGESRTQDHSHSKLGTFRSTTKVLLWTGAELGGCQGGHCPPKILPGPQWPPQNFPRDVMSLHWSPTQTTDSSPCCKTGPSSGPPKWKCLAPPLIVNMTKLSILFKPFHGGRPRLQPFSLSGYFHHVLSNEL